MPGIWIVVGTSTWERASSDVQSVGSTRSKLHQSSLPPWWSSIASVLGAPARMDRDSGAVPELGRDPVRLLKGGLMWVCPVEPRGEFGHGRANGRCVEWRHEFTAPGGQEDRVPIGRPSSPTAR